MNGFHVLVESRPLGGGVITEFAGISYSLVLGFDMFPEMNKYAKYNTTAVLFINST